MPLPLIPAIIVVIVTAATTVVINWDSISKYFLGESFAVLGAKYTGKTTLIKYLTKKEIKFEGEWDSSSIENTSKSKYVKKDVKFLIKKNIDFDGDINFKATLWEDMIVKADYVLYMLNLNLFYNEEEEEKEKYHKRVKVDLQDIERWMIDNDKKRIYIIATFVDKLPGYPIENSKENKNFCSKLKELMHDFVKETFSRNLTPTVIVVSLDGKYIERNSYVIMKTIKNS